MPTGPRSRGWGRACGAGRAGALLTCWCTCASCSRTAATRCPPGSVLWTAATRTSRSLKAPRRPEPVRISSVHSLYSPPARPSVLSPLRPCWGGGGGTRTPAQNRSSYPSEPSLTGAQRPATLSPPAKAEMLPVGPQWGPQRALTSRAQPVHKVRLRHRP